MASITPQLPQLRSYRNEMRRNLMAQHELAPMMFMDEAMFQPLYTGLNLQNMDMLLNGTPESTFTYNDWHPAQWVGPRSRGSGGGGNDSFFDFGGGFPMPPGMSGFGSDGPPIPKPKPFKSMGIGLGGRRTGQRKGLDLPGMGGGLPGLGGMFGGDDDDNKPRGYAKPGYYTQRPVNRPAQRGLLSIYEQDINPAMARMQSFQRGADIADVARLGPEARAAIRASNPDVARIMDMMSSQATDELGMGAALDPSMMRNVSQAIRGRQAGSLMSNGNAGAYNEALGLSQFGQQLRDSRRGFAGNVVGLNQSVYGDPFQAILNRSSGGGAAMGAAGQAAGIGGMSGPRLFNPESPYAQDIHNTNFNAQAARNIAAANNTAGLIGAGISAVGNLAGGAMGMI